jgi:hypothetical protein
VSCCSKAGLFRSAVARFKNFRYRHRECLACIVGSVISNNAAALLLYPIVVDLSAEARGGGGDAPPLAAVMDGQLDQRQAVLVLR